MKILLIANSFGVNLQKYAKEIAKCNGLDLSIYTLYIGGCPLSTHAKNIEEYNEDYELFIDGSSTGRFVSINDALTFEEWDYVSLQQASHLSGDVNSYYPYLNSVYTYVKKICPNTKMMWHQTWAYSGKNPYKYDEVRKWQPSFAFRNDKEMKAGIDLSLFKIMKDFQFDLVIKSGDVVFEAMNTFDDVYDSEGFHLNDLGCYLIGTNLVKKLINRRIRDVYVPKELDEKTCRKAARFINFYELNS